MTEQRLEEERSKILLRLNGQEGQQKGRPRLLFELAGVEARLGRTDDAIYALRDAIASGLDVSYVEDLEDSPHFESLDSLPAFRTLISSFQGDQVPFQYIYAKGEKERCDETFLCSVCNDPLVDPVIHDECGTAMCSACVSPCAECPHCHTPNASMTKLMIRTILNRLAGLKVYCYRCQKLMERSALSNHLTSCEILCKHGCKTKIPPSELEEHARICTAVLVHCPARDVSCPWEGMRRGVADHARKCHFARNQVLLERVAALEAANRDLSARLEAANRDVYARLCKLECTGREGVENIVQ